MYTQKKLTECVTGWFVQRYGLTQKFIARKFNIIGHKYLQFMVTFVVQAIIIHNIPLHKRYNYGKGRHPQN